MTTFSVPEMSCGHCRAKIEDAILDADEGAALDFDMDARKVDIDSTLATEDVLAAMKSAGYEATASA